MSKKRVGIYIDEDLWAEVKHQALKRSVLMNGVFSASQMVEIALKGLMGSIKGELPQRHYGVEKPIMGEHDVTTPGPNVKTEEPDKEKGIITEAPNVHFSQMENSDYGESDDPGTVLFDESGKTDVEVEKNGATTTITWAEDPVKNLTGDLKTDAEILAEGQAKLDAEREKRNVKQEKIAKVVAKVESLTGQSGPRPKKGGKNA